MTMNTKQTAANVEQVVRVQNGWVMLVVVVGLLLGAALLIFSIQDGTQASGQPHASLIVACLLFLGVCVVMLKGFFTLQPNEARVLVLFGDYKGTVRTSGFHWGNPFYTNGSQQAEAVIAARQKIVQGAVSMVDMALKELAEKQVLVLDDERKAAMVSNLMVVLCGESEVHPVLNTGTLYN
jgi:regulator of protease activity HflC (stomatin/prohibitin superfamily)